MQSDESGRKPDPSLYASERAAAKKSWERLRDDKMRFIQHAMDVSGATITISKLLILVDLQGVYLALNEWLSSRGVPIDDGLIIGRFAQLQIERTSKEVAMRMAAAQPRPTMDFGQLFDSVEIDYVDDQPRLGKRLDVLREGAYLAISTSFEIFYAPVPLDEIEWKLRMSAKRGSAEARDQLKKIKLGVVTRKGVFERDYKAYGDFVSYLKGSTHHAGSHEGFFVNGVGERGLKYFDEKEVDTRIAIRAMDALYAREADVICIVSSDQDFLPLHSRAKDFGVTLFQADLAKFMAGDKVGSKLYGMGEAFIRGGIDPGWPLEILTEAVSSPERGHFAKFKLSEEELHALGRLHNELNELKVELDVKPDGKLSMRLYRPK